MTIMAISNHDFDPSEVCITWKILKTNNINVKFASIDGKRGYADETILTGKGLGIFKNILMAGNDAKEAYNELIKDPDFTKPIRYSDIDVNDYNALILPGGHAKGVKPYLESEILQKKVIEFDQKNKIIAAICHGVIVAARSINTETNKSFLYGKKTTSLLQIQELLAYFMTFIWLGDYYRTYTMPVEKEVKKCLKSKDDFIKGPFSIKHDSLKNMNAGFAVVDSNYISARWPGDVYNFGHAIVDKYKSIYKGEHYDNKF
jgi:protease I